VSHHAPGVDHVVDAAGQERRALGTPEGLGARRLPRSTSQGVKGNWWRSAKRPMAAGVVAAHAHILGTECLSAVWYIGGRHRLSAVQPGVSSWIEKKPPGAGPGVGRCDARHRFLIAQGNTGEPDLPLDGVWHTRIRRNVWIQPRNLPGPRPLAPLGSWGGDGVGLEEQETAETGQSLWQQTNLLSGKRGANSCRRRCPSLADSPAAQPGPLAGRAGFRTAC